MPPTPDVYKRQDMPSLHILPPQSYLHFGFLINQAKGIVTDSGNIDVYKRQV